MHNKHSYIPHIDGLRAVAVLSVVIYHAFPTVIKAGFMGVDVFFVISGYLITSILLNELENGTYSLLNFYKRRIKRLFPALILVIATVYSIGWFMLIENEFIAMNKHILGGAGFISNIILWFEAGYFDQSSHYKLFLHFWSLGVEEQYYIVIPILIYVLYKLRFNILIIVALLAFTSFIYGYVLIGADKTAAFYNPLARSWELLAGTMLAILMRQGKTRLFEWQITAIIGLFLILVPILIFNKDIAFPGLYALMPVTGAVLVIAAGEKAWVNRVILGNRLAIFIGLISYPLYLWHWSLLSFLHINEQANPSSIKRLAAVCLSFLLAYLTYRFVEKPLKKRDNAVFLFASMIIIALIAALSYMGVIKQRLNFVGYEKINTAKNGFTFPITGLKPVGNFYTYGENQHATIYIGDSTMQHYAPRIKQAIDQNSAFNRAIFATKGGCPAINGFDNEPQLYYADCLKHNREAFQKAGQAEVKTVVLGLHWLDQMMGSHLKSLTLNGVKTIKPASELADAALAEMGRQIAELAKTKRVFVISASPLNDRFNPNNAVEGSRFTQLKLKDLSQALEVNAAYKPLQDKIIAMVKAAGGVVIDPLPAICPNGLCPITDARGALNYSDSFHFTRKTAIDKAQFMDITLTP
jgi:peptidoglycan/LPS O-acetylase OafA/YrhL